MGDEYQLRKDIDEIKLLVDKVDGLPSELRTEIDKIYSKLEKYYDISEIEDRISSLNNNQESRILALGLGVFFFEDKNLCVELPLNAVNVFEINEDGELEVEWDGNPFSIDNDGFLRFDDEL